jgi:hypothetical protein
MKVGWRVEWSEIETVERLRSAGAAGWGTPEQLIEPERNQLGCHREIECHSQIFPARLIRALGAFTYLLLLKKGNVRYGKNKKLPNMQSHIFR